VIREDLKPAYILFKRFLQPFWKQVIVVATLSVIVGMGLSLRPLVIAPALDAFVDTQVEPANSIADISLNNLGPTLLSMFNLEDRNILNIGLVVAGLYFSATLIIALIDLIAFSIVIRVRTAILSNMTIALHKHMLTLPLAYFLKAKSGDLVSRLTYDVAKTTNALDRIALGLLKSSAQIIITFAILLKTDPVFTLAVIILGSLHMVVTKILGNRVKEKAKLATENTGRMGSSLLETFLGIRLIKSFAAEKHDANRVADVARSLSEHRKRLAITKYYEVPMRLVVDAVLICAVLLLVFYAVSENRLTLSAAGLFFLLSQRLNGPFTEFFSSLLSLQEMLGIADRVVQSFATKNRMKRGTKKVASLENSIVLQNVSYEYVKDTPVLKNISLDIKKGEMLAMVGSSGSGKSTLADLVLRLHDVTDGSITYDGVDIREFGQRSFRRQFGVVAQECLLFNCSIRENIIFNSSDDEKKLKHAIWVANAEKFIREMPDGVDTLVGDRGIRLSGGQRQRIAIARAIYSQPSILILDEATSALDTESERAVQDAISRVSKEVTSIVIAHRLSTITHADKIVVLKDGKVEATGTHDELLNKSQTYKNLYRMQFLDSADFRELLPE